MTSVTWKPTPGFEDIEYEKSPHGIARKRKPDHEKFGRLP